MATHESSIADSIKSAVRDAQDLVRAEIALAKAEARAEMGRLTRGAVLLGVAALVGVICAVLLFVTIALAVSVLLVWPLWAGFATVTLLTLIIAAILAVAGRRRLRDLRKMPRTVDTMKENLAWIKARTS